MITMSPDDSPCALGDERRNSAMPSPLNDAALRVEELSSGLVDIWELVIGGGSEFSTNVLAQDEQERAARFKFERDRTRFVACRVWLRTVLGTYLGLEHARVRSQYEDNGKPQIDDSQNSLRLQFNLSHSGDFAVLGTASGRRVGVDIERIHTDRELIPIAQRFFSQREIEGLRAVSATVQRAAFTACWT